MAKVVPNALILGHSFVRRLKLDLELGFDPRAACDFNLRGTASVHLHGVGGRTVQTLEENDLHVVRDLAPDIVILEIGTNDLSHALPQTVGSQIEEFVRLLRRVYFVRVIGGLWCHPTWHFRAACYGILGPRYTFKSLC